MFQAASNVLRLIAIGRTLARHDALFPLEMLDATRPVAFIARFMGGKRRTEGRPGERLARALAESGPSFIKLGQALSVRSDLVGEEVAEDLSRLQDSLPPFPTDEAKAALEADLGAPLEELFSEFDPKPIAAASIAQVHFAVTSDGREVAVKILRPGVRSQFMKDLELFYWLAGIAERTMPALRRLKPVAVVETFEDSVTIEMDLRLEAAAASELKENTADDEGFEVPAVDWQRTGRRVLTLERVHGVNIDEVPGLDEAGFDVDILLETAARIFFLQVFRDGFFHADMHPGNMFVTEDGILTPVDFGIMGRLDRKSRNYLADMLLGFLDRDYDRVADVHFEAGYVPRHKSRDAFKQAVRSIGEPLFDRPLEEISIARLLAQLFQITETFEMETRPELLLLQKSMLVAEGVGRKLNPAVNMWLLARPLIEKWMIENRGPEARVRETLDNAIEILERLPETLARAEDVASMVADGGLKLHPDTVAAMRGRRAGQRGGGGILAIAAVAVAAIVLGVVAMVAD